MLSRVALEFFFKSSALCFLILCLNGCQSDSLFYYITKQGFHQGALLLKAKDNSKVLSDPLTPEQTQNYIHLAQEVLEFAKSHAGMKLNKNYSHFIQVDRDHITTIVTAAYKDRLEPFLFEYPIVGKLPYKGFFDDTEARNFQNKLKDQGFDTTLRPVDAFSTLGWLPDPLLSTMFKSPARFTELLFHELTHAQFYFKSNADFNEAFASWLGFKLAIDFANSKPKAFDRFGVSNTEIVKELTDSHHTQKQLAFMILKIKELALKHYSSPQASNREILFTSIKQLLNSSEISRIKNLAKSPWNNALILAYGTYYRWIDPIEKYALKNKLSPTDFLNKIVLTGESIVPEITQFE
jgi:predicted aminopeptidase